MDGQSVRLMGLVLPINWERDNQFKEYVLASKWGKCSHEVPAPHDQVIDVESQLPISIDQVPHGIFQGVKELYLWVEGTLGFSASAHTVFRGDGMMRAEVSYVIEPTAIAFPSIEELHTLFRASRQQSEALLCPKLVKLLNN